MCHAKYACDIANRPGKLQKEAKPVDEKTSLAFSAVNSKWGIDFARGTFGPSGRIEELRMRILTKPTNHSERSSVENG